MTNNSQYINNSINEIKPLSQQNNSITGDYARNSFFNSNGVYKPYSQGLKIRLQTLISDRGMTEPQFYKSIGISRNYWYLISYGRQEPTLELKLKIAKKLQTDSALIWQNRGKLE